MVGRPHKLASDPQVHRFASCRTRHAGVGGDHELTTGARRESLQTPFQSLKSFTSVRFVIRLILGAAVGDRSAGVGGSVIIWRLSILQGSFSRLLEGGMCRHRASRVNKRTNWMGNSSRRLHMHLRPTDIRIVAGIAVVGVGHEAEGVAGAADRLHQRFSPEAKNAGSSFTVFI